MRIWSTSGGYKIIQVLSGRSNVFLLTNGESNILIDTSPELMWKALQRRLKRLGIENINLLILTHAHFDHSANAHKVRERYNAQVIIHQSEAKYVMTGENIPPRGTIAVIDYMVRTFSKPLASIARCQPCKVDYTFDSIYDLSGWGFNAFLMHTPGHTGGSSSVIVDNEIALVGDAMFGVFWWSIFPPFAADQNQMINSWHKLLGTECKIFIPSHGTANKRSLVEKDFNKRNPNKK